MAAGQGGLRLAAGVGKGASEARECSSPARPQSPPRLQALQAELQVVKTAASRAMGQLEDSEMMAGPVSKGRAADKMRVEFKQVMSSDAVGTASPLMMARGSPGTSTRLLRQVRGA